MSASEQHELSRSLKSRHVSMIAIGGIIGAGIFVLTGTAAAKYAGPGVMISFLLSGLACTFVALYQGYEARPTPEGVAYATTRTVVISSLAVLCLDFILTALMFSTP